jgi:hypothetical protein
MFHGLKQELDYGSVSDGAKKVLYLRLKEEIMYHENMRRSQLLQIIDKFRLDQTKQTFVER